MSHSQPSRTPSRRTSIILVAGLLFVAPAIAVFVSNPAQASRSSMTSSGQPASSPWRADAPLAVRHGEPPGASEKASDAAPEGAMALGREHRGALGKADGLLPDDVSVLDANYPGVTNLDADLLRALRKVATRAAKDRIELFVTSGWRSRAYQEQLFRQAVSDYGSTAKAARWVATPGTSVHESGGAVDLGPIDATTWLSRHGARYGLCQIYRNEPWHFELRPTAVDEGCPRMYADPTHDPRMPS